MYKITYVCICSLFENQLQSIKFYDFALISGCACLVCVSHFLASILLLKMQRRTCRVLMQGLCFAFAVVPI